MVAQSFQSCSFFHLDCVFGDDQFLICLYLAHTAALTIRFNLTLLLLRENDVEGAAREWLPQQSIAVGEDDAFYDKLLADMYVPIYLLITREKVCLFSVCHSCLHSHEASSEQ